MDLSTIKQVVEVVGERGVNLYLEKGWVLIHTSTETEGDRSWVSYSLGWPNPLPAEKPELY